MKKFFSYNPMKLNRMYLLFPFFVPLIFFVAWRGLKDEIGSSVGVWIFFAIAIGYLIIVTLHRRKSGRSDILKSSKLIAFDGISKYIDVYEPGIWGIKAHYKVAWEHVDALEQLDYFELANGSIFRHAYDTYALHLTQSYPKLGDSIMFMIYDSSLLFSKKTAQRDQPMFIPEFEDRFQAVNKRHLVVN